MQLCTVALVPCKLILRVLLIQHVDDIAVTADLGQDATDTRLTTGAIALRNLRNAYEVPSWIAWPDS